MVSLRLNKQILEVVDNQLRENSPPCTKWAYRQLLEAGYSKNEARERLGAVVQMYNVTNNNTHFDQEKFEASVRDMVQKSIDFEEDFYALPEWSRIDERIEKGWSLLKENDYSGMAESWLEAWKEVRQSLAEADCKPGVSELDEATDYEYDLENWLEDVETELYNGGEHELRLVEKELKNQNCTFDNDILFLRAVELAKVLGEEEKLAGYEKQYSIFEV